MHLLMLTGLKMGPLLNYLRDCLLLGSSLGLSLPWDCLFSAAILY
jgi:hypothetical protein